MKHIKVKYKVALGLLLLVILACGVAIPQVAEATISEPFYGVRLTSLNNSNAYNGIPFAFGQIDFGLPSMWSQSDPTRIYIQQTCVYDVSWDITTLGTIYPNGADNTKIVIQVMKNMPLNTPANDQLQYTVAGETYFNENAYGARANSGAATITLNLGDYIQLVVNSKSGRVWVESNPSNVNTGIGNGKVSPHFVAACIGAIP